MTPLCWWKLCKRFAIRLVVTIGLGGTTLGAILLPPETHTSIALLGFAFNYLWIWET